MPSESFFQGLPQSAAEEHIAQVEREIERGEREIDRQAGDTEPVRAEPDAAETVVSTPEAPETPSLGVVTLERPAELDEKDRVPTGFFDKFKSTLVNLYDTKFGGNTGLPKIERQLDNYLQHIEYERKASGGQITERSKELSEDYKVIKEQYIRSLKRQAKEQGHDALSANQKRILLTDHMENGAKSMHSQLELNKLGFKNWNDLFSRSQLSQERIKQVIQEASNGNLDLEDTRNGFQRLFPAAKDALVGLTVAGGVAALTGGVGLIPLLGAAMAGTAGGQIMRGLFRSRELRKNVNGQGSLNIQMLSSIIRAQYSDRLQIFGQTTDGSIQDHSRMSSPEVRAKMETLRLVSDAKHQTAIDLASKYWKVDGTAKWLELGGKILGADAFALGNSVIHGVQQAHASLSGHQDMYRMHGSEVRQVIHPGDGTMPTLAPDEHLVRYAVDPTTGHGAMHVIEKASDAVSAHGQAHVFNDASNGFSGHAPLNSDVYAAAHTGSTQYDLLHIADHSVSENGLTETFSLQNMQGWLPFILAQGGVSALQEMVAGKYRNGLDLGNAMYVHRVPAQPAQTPPQQPQEGGGPTPDDPPAPQDDTGQPNNPMPQGVPQGGTEPTPKPNEQQDTGTPEPAPSTAEGNPGTELDPNQERAKSLADRQLKAQKDKDDLKNIAIEHNMKDDQQKISALQDSINSWQQTWKSSELKAAPMILRVNVSKKRDNLIDHLKPKIESAKANGSPVFIVADTLDGNLANNPAELIKTYKESLSLGDQDAIKVVQPRSFFAKHIDAVIATEAVLSSTEKWDVQYNAVWLENKNASEVHKSPGGNPKS